MTPAGTVSSLVVDSHAPDVVGSFWQVLLGGELVPYPELGVVTLRAPGITLDFVRNAEDKRTKNRWHLDLAAPDPVSTIEFALAQGATRADDVCVSDDFTVLRDPEGNEFCVLSSAPSHAPWAPVDVAR